MSQRKSKCKDSENGAVPIACNSSTPHRPRPSAVVTMDEIELKEKEMMGFTMQLSRALRMGEAHGHGGRIRENIKSEGVSIPNLTAKI